VTSGLVCLFSIPASSDTEESEGWHNVHKKRKIRNPPFNSLPFLFVYLFFGEGQECVEDFFAFVTILK